MKFYHGEKYTRTQLKLYTAIFIMVVIFFMMSMLFYKSSDAGYFTWNTFHRFPKTVLFISKDASLAVEIGDYYFNADGDGVYDLEKAQVYFKKALDLDPRVPLAWYQLARIDFLNGDFGDALFKMNKHISVHGDSLPNVYYMRGLIYGYDNQLEVAEKNFLKYLSYDKFSWAAYTDLAWVYFRQGKYEETKKIAERGLEKNAGNPWLLNMYGVALLNLGDKKSAYATLEQALSRAKKIQLIDWARAYPGNDPRVAEEGIKAMLEAIEYNLTLAVD